MALLGFGDRLKAAMDSAGVSISALHRAMQEQKVPGSAYSTLLTYLKGEGNPSVEFAVAAAEILGVSFDWLSTGRTVVYDGSRAMSALDDGLLATGWLFVQAAVDERLGRDYARLKPWLRDQTFLAIYSLAAEILVSQGVISGESDLREAAIKYPGGVDPFASEADTASSRAVELALSPLQALGVAHLGARPEALDAVVLQTAISLRSLISTADEWARAEVRGRKPSRSVMEEDVSAFRDFLELVRTLSPEGQAAAETVLSDGLKVRLWRDEQEEEGASAAEEHAIRRGAVRSARNRLP